jgi:preprotein translocase subunit SecD
MGLQFSIAVAAGPLISACVPSGGPSRPETATGLQVRLAELSPGPGLERISSAGTTLYLRPDSLITSADASLIKTIVSPAGDHRVVVQLRDGVPDRLAPVLRAHGGGTLAIIVDGRLVSTQTISGSFGGRLTIANQFSKADAEAIAAAI